MALIYLSLNWMPIKENIQTTIVSLFIAMNEFFLETVASQFSNTHKKKK